MTPEVRLSPDGRRVAIRLPDHNGLWSTTAGPMRTDSDVSDWPLLLPVSSPKRVTCWSCGREGRALDPRGRIRWHHGIGPDYWSAPCPGTGTLPLSSEDGAA